MQVGAGDTARGSAAKDWITGPARRLPWVTPASNRLDLLRSLGVDAALAARRIVGTSETAAEFVAPECFLLGGVQPRVTARQLAELAVETREDLETAILEAKRSLDLEWATEYGLDQRALQILDTELEPDPASYSPDRVIPADTFAAAYLSKDAVVLDGGIAEEQLLDSRVEARLRSQVGLRSLADLCHLFAVPPRAVAAKRRSLALLRQDDLRGVADDLLSYLMGVALGRWDVRIGRNPSLAPAPLGLFDPLPVCPPGMLVGDDDLPVKGTPLDYPIDLPPARLLIDEPGHPWDIEASIFRAAAALFDDPITIVAELLQILGRKSVREHFRKQFFKDHLSRYSKSRRKAPIYWPLTVPSKNWGVWVYTPMLTRETLYSVVSETARRERLAGEAIARLQREQHGGGAGRPARKVAEELDAEAKLAEELRRFRTEAERIAALGWEPDLDDGIILSAAPLADLFPSWPAATMVRADLRKGKYEWATVAAWADQL